MAKIKTTELIKEISGRTSSGEKFYYYTNKVSGKQSIRKIGNTSDKEPTPAQKAQREEFKKKTEEIKRWFDENKPSEKQPEGSVSYRSYQNMMKAEGKTNDFYHFVWRQIFTKK